ncbi:MAG: hypothetical protein ABJG14_06920 [Sulfitobacter sp.]|uniref:hypothetical protein n=1 Tax=Alphaproteobacteria TaxID=28211 RepID=UPI0032675C24
MAYHGKYSSPTELLHDENLSHHEKVEMLTQWRDDKKALIRASEDGMQGDDRSEFLRKIKDGLISLRNGSASR